MSFQIIGTGAGHPKKAVPNAVLETMMDTSDEWITTRTGIRERRVLTDESICDLAEEAGKKAIESSGIDKSKINLLLVTTIGGDYISPSVSCLVAKRLGLNCPSLFDINQACSGFLYALDIADAYFCAGKVENALVISAEAMSRRTDWTDRSTCVLFGDGAGAVVLGKGDGLKAISLKNNGSAENLYVASPSGNSPFSANSSTDVYVRMDGQEIYKFAVNSIVHETQEILQRLSLTPDDIDIYVLHQANSRIIDSARRKLGQPADKFPMNLDRYGNTSSASVPMLLDELYRNGTVCKGKRVLISAFGAGLATGTCVMEF